MSSNLLMMYPGRGSWSLEITSSKTSSSDTEPLPSQCQSHRFLLTEAAKPNVNSKSFFGHSLLTSSASRNSANKFIGRALLIVTLAANTAIRH